MPRRRKPPRHRTKHPQGELPFSACVARPVGKAEWQAAEKGRAAHDEEWMNFRGRNVWNDKTVREWSDVAREDREQNKTVHFEYLFGMMFEKNTELREDDINDPRRKYKYRVLFRGNDVKDQNFDVALFQDMGSGASTMDANRSCDLYGCLPGHCTQQADAEQGHIQVTIPLDATPTWVVLPED